MQTANERSKLLERYGAGEPRPLLAVLKCVAGLVALIAVSAAPWLLAGANGGDAVEIPAIPGAATAFPSSMAESKRIFDERRGRYEAGAGRTQSTQGSALAQDLNAKASPGDEGARRDAPLIP